MSSSAPLSRNPSHVRNSPRRPPTISELANKALEGLYDEKRELKHHLRNAEKYRRDAKAFLEKDDLENAFVMYAKAATLVLDKLPTHRDYHKLLNSSQRQNLGMHGQDILESLTEIKPMLVARSDQWQAQHPEYSDNDHPPDSRQESMPAEQPTSSLDDFTNALLQQQKMAGETAIEEELAKWKQLREDRDRLAQEDREREERERGSRGAGRVDLRQDPAVAAAARQAPITPQRAPDYTFSRTPLQNAGYGTQHTAVLSDGSRRVDDQARYQQQEDMRRREEDIARKRAEQKRRQEQQEGIARRQQEADNAARDIRQTTAVNNPGATLSATSSASSISSSSSPMFNTPTAPSSLATTPSSSFQQIPPTPINYPPIGASSSSNVRAPQAYRSRPPSFLDVGECPTPLPLESPTKYDGDSTDSESITNHHDYRRGKQKHVDNSKTPTRTPLRSPSYPPPTTTTSPPPPESGSILYPQLMSYHQRAQGYWPSLNSMFVPPPDAHLGKGSSLLFPVPADPNSHTPTNKPLYPPEALQRQPSNPQQWAPGQNQYQQQHPPPHQPPNPRPPPAPPIPPSHSHPQGQYSSYPGSSRPEPPAPRAEPSPKPPTEERIIPNNAQSSTPALKTVILPRECLPRFLSIAKLNTVRNRETCGLLLGKDKGSKYVVSTLLIPKQHSTSDTCTMDEEELVMEFTEERNLITLGWIHTHPSQSCFMSSVDLHTHSGFQCMLSESFAVVCAPKSNPNFGIFRLTDPPGLQTILHCKEKEAFHPHPDLPIYTDADKGHVHMRDAPLEIVDLR
ncbi:hypothetical protein BDQ12DRAFT_692894 [Crucibulum laeve]|uniref:MPN domain-containing protein n=1 Tax=Crucibulum laeve TaxID=68775 RepID=A0A5C3LTT3_9AGAR|nr:hypothetical protein BDQ12DRAFT_692894 [Crucibulum laeve]